jgi:hypothetical protein
MARLFKYVLLVMGAGIVYSYGSGVLSLAVRMPLSLVASCFQSTSHQAMSIARAAMNNATQDYRQLAMYVDEWLTSQDETVVASFQENMNARAGFRPGLEGLLDWLLVLYKFLAPFFLLSLMTRQVRDSSRKHGDIPEALELHSREALETQKVDKGVEMEVMTPDQAHDTKMTWAST